ncbi:MAG TPA: family 16 glycoside hydrolase [Verrucomicrobiae bacterium]|nr:family 16 glycoside hydrolase [Verrucomicrobiae bacterium]
MRTFFRCISWLALAANLCVAQDGTGWTFQPEFTFSGSNLDRWRTVGKADWSAKEGEIVGLLKEPEQSGLLLFDQSLQDVAFHAAFRCSENAEAGIVFRLEESSRGFKGILVSIKNGDVNSYAVAFDSNGNETKREQLRSAGPDPLARIAPLPDSNKVASANQRSERSRHRDAKLDNNAKPLSRPDTSFRSNAWNQIEVFLDANIIRAFLNDGAPTSVGAADEIDGSFGPIALYVSGTGEARFKQIGLKDAAIRVTPKEQSSPRFQVQRISDMFYSWAAAAGDFNRDGAMDIVAGPVIYYGPEFTRHREIFPATTLNPSRMFPEINCQYVFDFNDDRWPDILTGPPQATLYLNPKGESRRWEKHVVIPSVQSEITAFQEIDGSGMPALIYASEGTLRYAKADRQNPSAPWQEHIISEKGFAMAHGIGAGDLNSDGRVDVLNPNGWWEQPAKRADRELWIYHPVAFARYGHRSTGAGGAAMGVFDVNGDGLNDVVTSLNAHGFGLAWFEQQRAPDGGISFVRHMIADDYGSTNSGGITFSEAHGAAFGDLDNDGVIDFIVGKRYWSHLDSYFDPDPYGAPVLYWYRTVRNASASGGAEFVPQLIHNRSGAGSDVLLVDLNKDGFEEVIVSTDRGTFVFWNTGSGKISAN